MSLNSRLAMPWAHPSSVYSAPGSLIVKLALGEAPRDIPTAADVRLGARPPAASIGDGHINRVLRHFSDTVRIARVHAAAASIDRPGQGHEGYDGLEHAIGLSRTFRIDLDRTASIGAVVDALRHVTIVEHAYPHYFSTIPFAAPAPVTDPIQAWRARELIRAAEAMAYEPGDPAVIVAIVDTGVLAEHPELQSRLRHGCDTVRLHPGDLPMGIRLSGYADSTGDPEEDRVGHGTACAAIIGAIGAVIPPGLGGGCGLLPTHALGAALFPGHTDPVGIGAIADIDAGIKSSIDLGAKVINMSFGTPVSAFGPMEPQPHADVIQYGIARGCIMVAASGNSGKEEAFSPANIDGVIAVGAADTEGRPARFSARGEHVALCAPGERIVSAGLHGYSLVTGTSFAAPFVAAAAALLVSRAERRAYALNGVAARRILCAAARPWPMSAGYQGHGAGLLDAFGALQALDREIDEAAGRDGVLGGGSTASKGGGSNAEAYA